MKKVLLASALLLFPALAFGAGFAKDSLFLSKSPVTEGDSVRIYTIIANTSAAKFSGTVLVKDGDAKLGSPPVVIDSGATQTISVTWRPAAGSHIITASLVGSDGATVEQESGSFTILAKPKPVTIITPSTTTNAQPAAVESSQQIQNQIGTFSPAAENISKPAFTVLDGLRNTAAQAIDTQIANTKNNLAKNPQPGVVEGAQTQAPALPNPTNSFWYIFYTIYLYILTILRFLVGNAGVFYPVLALVFFYILWKSFKRYRRA